MDLRPKYSTSASLGETNTVHGCPPISPPGSPKDIGCPASLLLRGLLRRPETGATGCEWAQAMVILPPTTHRHPIDQRPLLYGRRSATDPEASDASEALPVPREPDTIRSRPFVHYLQGRSLRSPPRAATFHRRDPSAGTGDHRRRECDGRRNCLHLLAERSVSPIVSCSVPKKPQEKTGDSSSEISREIRRYSPCASTSIGFSSSRGPTGLWSQTGM